MSDYKYIYKTKRKSLPSSDLKKSEQVLLMIWVVVVFVLIYQNYQDVFWYILIGFLLVIWLWVYAYRYYENYRLSKYNSFEKICKMDPYDFEKLCAKILENKWHTNVSVTKASADGWIDIFSTKDKRKYAIQCKRYNGWNYVTVMQVREVFGVAKSLGDMQAMIICTGHYSHDAVAFAKQNNIIIINKDKFISDFLPFIK